MKTERIIFESVSKNDFKDLVNLFTCSQVRKYLGGALDYNLACDKAERLIRRELSEQMWILRDKCQKFIGIIEIGKHHDSDELEISYQLISSAWGKGFMLEAMKMVIQYMFEGQKIDKILAETQAKNLKSIALVKKLGFVEIKKLKRFGEMQILL